MSAGELAAGLIGIAEDLETMPLLEHLTAVQAVLTGVAKILNTSNRADGERLTSTLAALTEEVQAAKDYLPAAATSLRSAAAQV
ncbi:MULTISPECIES: hypothetical protein [unclassified Crossiella]|uniref:hypothetical protein n=1 Tax=unclassified Crossiella TaxID=2620835 RepID=UPI001FFE886B|nr:MULTISPECIES: hypothetical protein [unclassified Crossiella]MCK2237738.1 hypothetical protein [Crossiella sp. S99.2]MCK2255024.1 hypothetical protein [Crossiella sp. S99.1]